MAVTTKVEVPWAAPRASKVAARYRARETARLYVAKKFTPESWAAYKKKHPKADVRRHEIVKPGKGKPEKGKPGKSAPVRKKLDRVIQSISGVSKAVVKSLREAPKKVQKFVVDKDYRDQVTKAAAKAAKSSPGKLKKSIIQSGKSELKAIFKEAPSILGKLAKEKRPPTKEEAKTLYGVGVYVAGTILAMSGAASAGSGHGAAAVALMSGAKAFGHSLSLHIGIKAMNRLADEGFLAYEATESGAQAAGLADALPVNTGDLPGLGQVWDAVGKLVTGDEKKPEPTLDRMVERLVEIVGDELEKGISDEEMVKVLKEEQP